MTYEFDDDYEDDTVVDMPDCEHCPYKSTMLCPYKNDGSTEKGDCKWMSR